MYMDASLALCRNTAVPASDGYIGDVIDLRQQHSLLGSGTPLFFYLQIRTALAGGTNVTFSLRAANSVSSGNLGGATIDTHITTPLMTRTDGKIGVKFATTIPLCTWERIRRYVQVYADVSGTFTAGAIDAHLMLNHPHWVSLIAEPARIT